MSISVIKRDGTKVPFDSDKIYEAISGAVGDCEDSQICPHDITVAVNNIVKEIGDVTEISVEEIQDIVERYMMQCSNGDDSEHEWAEAAKTYILYRNQRTQARERKGKLFETYKSILAVNAEENDLMRENANVNAITTAGSMHMLGSESAKHYYLSTLINPLYAKAHKEGLIHIHDLSYYPYINCIQIPVTKLLERGFNTGHGYSRSPKSIGAAASLLCIIIQSSQNDMFK